MTNTLREPFIVSAISNLSDDKLDLATFINFRKKGVVNSNMSKDLFMQGLTIISKATCDFIMKDDEDLTIGRIMRSINKAGVHASQGWSFVFIDDDILLDFVTSNIDDVTTWVKSVKTVTDGYDLNHVYYNLGDSQALALNVAHLLQGYAFDVSGGGIEDDFILKVITGQFKVSDITKEFEVEGYYGQQVDRNVRTVLATLGRLILKSIASGWTAVMTTETLPSKTFSPFQLKTYS